MPKIGEKKHTKHLISIPSANLPAHTNNKKMLSPIAQDGYVKIPPNKSVEISTKIKIEKTSKL